MDYLAEIHRRLRNGPACMRALSLHLSIVFTMPTDTAVGYILGYISSGFLMYNDEGNICIAHNPSEEMEPYLYVKLVKSTCWSCGKEYEKEIPPALTMTNWECEDCQVKWSMAIRHKIDPELT